MVIHRTLNEINFVSFNKKPAEEKKTNCGLASSLHSQYVPLGKQMHPEYVNKSIDLNKSIIKGLKTEIKQNTRKARY